MTDRSGCSDFEKNSLITGVMFLFLWSLEPLGTRGFHNVLFMGEAERKGARQKLLHSNIYESISHTVEHCCKRDTLAQRGFGNVGSMIQTTSGQMFLLVIRIFLDRAECVCPGALSFFLSHVFPSMDEGGWWMPFVLPHPEICQLFFFLSYSSFIQSQCRCVCVCLSESVNAHAWVTD